MDERLKKGLFGRREIFTSETEIINENIEDILKKAMFIHEQNRVEIEYLFNYHKGKQPILDRVKEIRPEINHRICENHASEIVAFKTGYVFGSPIMLVQRGRNDINKSDENEDDTRISSLNEVMFEENKQSKDMKLGRSMSICGIGHRLIYPKRERTGNSPFDIINLDSQGTFVVRSNDVYKSPILGITYVKDCDSTEIKATAYSDKAIWQLKGGVNGGFKIIQSQEPNPLGMIPIIEYPNNEDRMGDFETVMPLLDALNIGLSDRLNDVSQHVQSLLWFNNCDIDEKQFAELKAQGGIKTKSEQGNPASVQYLVSILDQAETQTLIDYIYDTVRAISGTPDRNISTGGSTGSAIQLAGGWETAEAMAKNTELQFGESQREELKIILKIIQDIPIENVDLSKLSLSDVDIKFSRSKNDNALVKGQNLLNQLEAGVHPREAIKTSNLYSDPEQVYIDSNKNGGFEKWKTTKETKSNNQKQGVI